MFAARSWPALESSCRRRFCLLSARQHTQPIVEHSNTLRFWSMLPCASAACRQQAARMRMPKAEACNSLRLCVAPAPVARVFIQRRTFRIGTALDAEPAAPVIRLGRYRVAADAAQRAVAASQLLLPHEWYPGARAMRRRIIAHVGPTNSGKTHRALAALAAAARGVYCGPLRLLAWEIFERMNAAGTPCNLTTGQEREEVEGAGHVSSTVEMVDLRRPAAVAVVDEIQMIADPSRGWAWTRAVLGLEVPEIHVCGDPAAIPLLQRLVALTGDDLTVHEYKRLSPLQVAKQPLRALAHVTPGDCIVAFSRRELFDIKKQVESTTSLRCGIIYGALPPAVRREQARRFNSDGNGAGGEPSAGDRTHVLVATDAIGMGLNLAIRRVIFSKTVKFDGSSRRELTVSEIKQIGGRAGRYGSAFANGEVSCMSGPSMSLISRSMKAPTPPLLAAGVLPTLEQLEAFAASLLPDVFAVTEEELRVSGKRKFPPRAARSMWYGGDAGVGGCGVVDGDGDGVGAAAALAAFDARAVSHSSARVRSAAQRASEGLPFSHILAAFLDRVELRSDDYFLCEYDDMVRIAELLDDVPLEFSDRYLWCMCPIDLDEQLCVAALKRYAHRFTTRESVKVGLRLPAAPPTTPAELAELEAAHAVFDLYIWLARRFPRNFTQLEQAEAGARATQELIQSGLEAMSDLHRAQAQRPPRRGAILRDGRRGRAPSHSSSNVARQRHKRSDVRSHHRQLTVHQLEVALAEAVPSRSRSRRQSAAEAKYRRTTQYWRSMQEEGDSREQQWERDALR